MKARLSRAAIVIGGSLLAPPAGAIITSTWTVETYQQFDGGDASSAFITSAGEVRPGWDTKRTAIEGDAVWSSVKLADGSVLLGSDAGGSIYRITGDASKKVVSIPGAIAVVALTQTADGSVYAGAMPGNKLFKIDVAGGKATATATLTAKDPKDVETIWSLASVGNTVYAGTGPSGKLFAVTSIASIRSRVRSHVCVPSRLVARIVASRPWVAHATMPSASTSPIARPGPQPSVRCQVQDLVERSARAISEGADVSVSSAAV